MFVCPIDIPPVPVQIHESWGTPLPDPGEFCGFNVDGVPQKCVCTAEEHELYAPQYGDEVIPVIPYDASLEKKPVNHTLWYLLVGPLYFIKLLLQ